MPPMKWRWIATTRSLCWLRDRPRKTLRILHVIGSVAARDGGPSVAVEGMSTALAALGAEVTVATTNADGPRDTLDVVLDRPVVRDNVEYRYFERNFPGTWGFSLPLARWLRRNVGDYDVVEVHGLFVFATIAGCRAARRAGVPYVVRPLGMLDPWSLRQRAWKKRPYMRFIERPHLQYSAAIHATSESEAASVRMLGFGDRVRTIPLGVRPVAAQSVERRSASSADLLFLSRLHPKKNIPLLLQALHLARARGAHLTLTIAGAGTPAYRAELEREVEALSLSNVVRFVGEVHGPEKEALLRASDAFVLLSSQENFGIAVAEALAAGLPVVISDQVAIAPAVAEAGAGLVVPLDSDTAAAALISIASDPARRLAMGRRARELATEQYSWERAARSLRDLFAELIAARPQHSRP